MTGKPTYVVALSWNMVCAIVDIASGYVGPESTRFHVRTCRALERRGIVKRLPDEEKLTELLARGGKIMARLTKKGEAFVDPSNILFKELEAVFEAEAERAAA